VILNTDTSTQYNDRPIIISYINYHWFTLHSTDKIFDKK
jgi:hypothetical protein